MHLLLFFVLATLSQAASFIKPPALPLTVRTPYLSTWLPNARGVPWEQWPFFYTGESIGFGILASVPESGIIYPLLGRPQDALGDSKKYNISFPRYKGPTYDASTTNLTYHIPPPPSSQAEPVELILSFICPVTPTSTLRQALPACYISVNAEGSFDVSIYIDINGQWVSGDRGSLIEWDFINSDSSNSDNAAFKTWKIKKQQEALFTEWADRAEWGTLYFSGPAVADHQAGVSSHLRQTFAKQRKLNNTVDDAYRSIMDEEPVFAFSTSFSLSSASASSSSGKSQASALFTISLVQDPVVQYASRRGLTYMRPLWKSWFLTDIQMIGYHYNDFEHSFKLAKNYSEQVALDASKYSSEYVDILALTARQTLGATTFSGTSDNPFLFFKEIASNGNCQTVDVIFPSIPFFLYTNPRWIAYLLEPLLEYQNSGQYPNKYSIHDMGMHFPNETGHDDGADEYMPVEECGNMLIMGLMLAKSLRNPKTSIWASQGEAWLDPKAESPFPLTSLGSHGGFNELDDSFGGGSKGESQSLKWLSRNYGLLKQWADYLVDETLRPHNQLSTDDFTGWLPLQTNLALKGIIGLRAMSEIAEWVGDTKYVDYYLKIAEDYIKKWHEYGISRDGTHAQVSYEWYGSWTTLYSLYADALLCFHPSITSKKNQESSKPGYLEQINNLRQRPFGATKNPETASQKDFIPHELYTNQSDFYALVMQKYGLPLDSRHLYTLTDWQFEAAAVAEPKVRDEIVRRIALWMNETIADRPFVDLYETEGDGGYPGGIYFWARPVVGGHFAFLALDSVCQD